MPRHARLLSISISFFTVYRDVAAPDTRRRTLTTCVPYTRGQENRATHAIHTIDIVVSTVGFEEMIAISAAVIASKSLPKIISLHETISIKKWFVVK